MDNKDRVREILTQRRHKKFRERILREKEVDFAKWKKEIFESSESTISKEEREKRRKELLSFVDRYAFNSKLAPQSNLEQASTVTVGAWFLREQNFLKRFLTFILLFRNFVNATLKIKSILILVSAFFLFTVEYWLHYYSSFSLKDINITFKDIIDKIPPFF